MTAARGLLAIAFAALGAFALATGSAWWLDAEGPESASLRLSWSARPERIEQCRALSDAELAELAPHMRQRIQCEGRSATYDLEVSIDGEVTATALIHGGGLRRDRPIHLLEEYPIAAGTRRIQVTLTRRETPTVDSSPADTRVVAAEADTGLFAGRAEREVSERSRRGQASIPARLTLDTLVTLVPNEVGLVTFDEERRQLLLRTSSPIDD